MIPKLVLSDSYDYEEASSSLVPLHSRGVEDVWLKKHASSGVFSDYLQSLKPMPGKTVIHVIALGDEERYGCLAAGTKVALPNGSHASINELGVGDTVMSGTGRPREVTWCFNHKVAQAVRVRVEGLPEEVVMSLEHPVLKVSSETFVCALDKYRKRRPGVVGVGGMCKRGNGCTAYADGFELVRSLSRAETLKAGDYLVFKLPEISPVRAISEEEGRLIGYWLAEGCWTRNSGNKAATGWRFSFGKHERDTLVADVERIAKSIGLSCTIHDQTAQRSEWVVCLSGNPSLAREWESWFSSGSHNKRIPLWMLSLPKRVVTEVVYGYLCGDGHAHVSAKENRCTARSAGYDLAIGIQRLLWSLEVPAVVCAVTCAQHFQVSYALSKAPSRLKFNARELETTTTKHRSFIKDGFVYLPVRAVDILDFNGEVYNIEVDEDHDYVSVNFYSHNCNRNCDAFNRADNIAKHTTFVELGNVFKNHKNDDPKNAVGKVLSSAHNDVMDRVELLLGLDNEKCSNEIESLANGKDIGVSMGSVQDYDVCSYCGHRAPTAPEHCDHIKNMLGEVAEDGTRIYMKNPNPKFFDISIVFKPADRIAYTLRKVALSMPAIGGHELAANIGIRPWHSEKIATVQHLASIVKSIPAKGGPLPLSGGAKAAVKIACLRHGTNNVLHYLVKNACVLEPMDFVEAILGHQEPGAAAAAIHDDNALDDLLTDTTEVEAFKPDCENCVSFDDDIKQELHDKCSMEPGPAAKRSLTIIIVGGRRPKIASGLDSAERKGLALLYGHYKLAVAHFHRNSMPMLRSIAATFH